MRYICEVNVYLLVFIETYSVNYIHIFIFNAIA
jgi:hypothetical protein